MVVLSVFDLAVEHRGCHRQDVQRLVVEQVTALGHPLHGGPELLLLALGPIDLVVANAGVGTSTLLDRPNTADVEAMFRVNVFGMIYAFEAVLPEMLVLGSGACGGALLVVVADFSWSSCCCRVPWLFSARTARWRRRSESLWACNIWRARKTLPPLTSGCR